MEAGSVRRRRLFQKSRVVEMVRSGQRMGQTGLDDVWECRERKGKESMRLQGFWLKPLGG